MENIDLQELSSSFTEQMQAYKQALMEQTENLDDRIQAIIDLTINLTDASPMTIYLMNVLPELAK